jgi:hypothetical protein
MLSRFNTAGGAPVTHPGLDGRVQRALALRMKLLMF